jgi:hypothetical protein
MAAISHQPPTLLTATSRLSSTVAESESESYVTTDGQPASLSWNKALIWGLRPDLYYCLTVAGLLIWGALSDERTVLSFTVTAGRGQHSHFRVRVLLSQIQDFPFRRLLRLAGLRWSSRPRLHTGGSWPHREHRFQQVFYCCMRDCCGYYLSTAVIYRAITQQRLLYSCLFRSRCLATGLQATILKKEVSIIITVLERFK